VTLKSRLRVTQVGHVEVKGYKKDRATGIFAMAYKKSHDLSNFAIFSDIE